MKIFKVLILCFLSYLPLTPLTAQEVSVLNNFLGKWNAYSNTFIYFLGDLNITNEKLCFSRAGECKYQIVSNAKDRLLLKLDRKIDGVYYIAIGPMRKSEYSNDEMLLEMAFYNTKEKGLLALTKRDPMKGCEGWGIYFRKLKKTIE